MSNEQAKDIGVSILALARFCASEEPGVQSVMHKISANLKRPTRILYGISVILFSLVPLISVIHVGVKQAGKRTNM